MGDVDVLWVDHLGFLGVSELERSESCERGRVERSESGQDTRAKLEWSREQLD